MKILFKELNVRTPQREILINITDNVRNEVRESKLKEGICRVFVPHTTAGITINENADPSVIKDISNYLNRLIPKGGGLGYHFKHMEGNSDAHIKCLMTGQSIEIIIHDGRMMLGTWQGCYFVEYDGPRNRKVYLQLTGN